MNFCISSMGRSGTKFLSTILNQSRTWVVEHEPQDKHTTGLMTLDKLPLVQKRFDSNDKYGEVNSFLRLLLLDLNVDKKCVITRDPREVHVSSYNKRKGILDDLYYQQIREAFMVLDNIIESGIKRIRFDKMTSDHIYLTKIANYVGIEDIRYTRATHRKIINMKSHKLITCFDELPKEHQNKGMDCFNDYLIKYFIKDVKTNEIGD